MCIGDNIIFRYEENFKNGTLFIFDISQYRTYEGGKIEYCVLKNIRNGASLDEIIHTVENEFQIEDSRTGIEALVEDFRNKSIVV